MINFFSQPTNLETVDELILNLDGALGRFQAQHKK